MLVQFQLLIKSNGICADLSVLKILSGIKHYDT